MSRKKIRVRMPNAKAASSELSTLLKTSLQKTEELVSLNQRLMEENQKLNDEISHTLEEHEKDIEKLIKAVTELTISTRAAVQNSAIYGK